MDSADMQPEGSAQLAGFSERILAFSLDCALFAAGYFSSFRLAFPGYPMVLHPAMAAWPYMWAALFLVYQAFLSCEGRASLGKRLLGLRVVRDGAPLTLGQAVLRSMFYPVSGLLGLGFLWSLCNQERQCWHDMAVGSVVVREKSFAGARKVLVRGGAGLCLLALACAGMWTFVWGPRYRRIMTVAYAKVGLREMAQLQRICYRNKGHYAEDVFELAGVADDPNGFLQDAARLLDVKGLAFQNSAAGFTIMARALDEQHTPVSIAGP